MILKVKLKLFYKIKAYWFEEIIMKQTADDCIKASQLAKKLNISESLVRKMTANCQIPFIQISRGTIRYIYNEVVAKFRENQITF